MNKKYINFAILSTLLFALISDVGNSTTLKNKSMNAHLRFSRLEFRSMILVILAAILCITFLLSVAPIQAQAVGNSYDLVWRAADPAVNNGPYLPTYAKITPAFSPLPFGTVGRQADPLANAVAYGPTNASSDFDAVASLAPQDMVLGQIVPFEMVITVDGSTAPENGTIQFNTSFATETTSGCPFGYNQSYMVYAAFVDIADAGTSDPGNDATVDNYTNTSNADDFTGTFNVSGLDSGDQVVVEIWVVLNETIPSPCQGNVQTSVVDAQTATGDPIQVGAQAVPLLRVNQLAPQFADVSVVKIDIPDPVIQGQILNYSITVKNNDLINVSSGIIVNDTLDSNTTFLSATGAIPIINGNNLTFNVGGLSNNTTTTINISTIVSDTAWANNDTSTNPEPGTPGPRPTLFDLLNIVSVTASTNDSNITNNTYYQPTNVLPANPALLIIKTASPENYSTVGQNITYTYNVTNSGNVNITGPINVTDTIIGTITISNNGLAPGHSVTGTANYTITQADIDNGYVNNTAFATGRFRNDTVTSNPDNATVIAVQNPALLIVKIASPENYSTVGQNITYTYNVTNSGNVNITGPINVTDTIIGTITISNNGLAPGHSVTGTANYTITQADIDNGYVNNTAFATGRFRNDTVTSNPDNATVIAVQNPALLIVKIASPENYSTVGQNITYTYNVTNSGNVNITGPINVTDNITGIIQISASGLAPGHSVTGTANYTITQADIDNGYVNNTAFATGRFGNNTVTSNPDNATVIAVQRPALLILKTASPENYSTVGQNITYTYYVINSGNVNITGPINVTDDKIGIIQISASGLAPGQFVQGTVNYTITQADLERCPDCDHSDDWDHNNDNATPNDSDDWDHKNHNNDNATPNDSDDWDHKDHNNDNATPNDSDDWDHKDYNNDNATPNDSHHIVGCNGCNDNATPNDSDDWDRNNDNATPNDSDDWDRNNDNATPNDSDDWDRNNDNATPNDSDDWDHNNDNATPCPCSITNEAFATGTFGNSTVISNIDDATVTAKCPHHPDDSDDSDDSCDSDDSDDSCDSDDSDDSCDSDDSDDSNHSHDSDDSDDSCDSDDSTKSVLPIADFRTDISSGYAPLSVKFTDLSQNTVSRSWDFDNDGTEDSNDVNPNYTYITPGTYTANLTVSNSEGTDSKTTNITVLSSDSDDSYYSDDSDDSDDSYYSDDSDDSGEKATSSSGSGRGSSYNPEESGHATVVSASEENSVTGKSTATRTRIQPASGNKAQTPVNDAQKIDEKKNNTSTPAKDNKSTPGFEIVCGMTAMLAVYLYRRK